jgi:hypothetical protein
MNENFKKWIEFEKKAWDTPNYEYQEIENGLCVESEENGFQTVLWNTFLYNEMKEYFKENETFFVYTITAEEEENVETHYVEFSFDDTNIRVYFTKDDATIYYKVFFSDSFAFQNTSFHFHLLSIETLTYINETIQKLRNAIFEYPPYRIKFALRQLSMLTPEENKCEFDEYCIKEKIKM